LKCQTIASANVKKKYNWQWKKVCHLNNSTVGNVYFLALIVGNGKKFPITNCKNISPNFLSMSTFSRVNKYHSGTLEQTKIMGTRVAYCVDMDKSVIIGNFEKRGWVAG
jgi:hypothetical protein